MFNVAIEYRKTTLSVVMPALPRKGDLITLRYPSTARGALALRVSRVHFDQPNRAGFKEKACKDPFVVIVKVVDEPGFAAVNKTLFKGK